MLTSTKTYFSIREVCEITNLEPHVLRYWEGEFSILRPKKNRAGNRAYREKDIELIRQIQRLVHVEKYTIQGARKRLADIRKGIVEVPVEAEVDTSGNLPVEPAAPPAAESEPPLPEPISAPEPLPVPVPAVPAPPVPVAPAERIDAFALSLFDPQVQRAESFLSDRENVIRELKELLNLLAR